MKKPPRKSDSFIHPVRFTRTLSSVVERFVHIEEATGSSPVVSIENLMEQVKEVRGLPRANRRISVEKRQTEPLGDTVRRKSELIKV